MIQTSLQNMASRRTRGRARGLGEEERETEFAFSKTKGVFQGTEDQTQEDWQVNKSVLECNKHMLEQQINCDVTFQFGSGK